MTKISYEVVKKENGKEEAKMQLEGNGADLLKGFCRIAVKLKNQLDIDTNKEFLDLIDGGMNVMQLEDKFNDKDLSPLELLKELSKMIENEKKHD